MKVKGLIVSHVEPPAGPERWPLPDTPPELAPVANKPVLLHQLEALAAAGIEDLAVVSAPWTRDGVRAVLRGPARSPGVLHIAPSDPISILEGLMVAEEHLAGSPFVVQFAGNVVGLDLTTCVAELEEGAEAVLVGQQARSSRSAARLGAAAAAHSTVAVSPAVGGLRRVDVMAFGPGVFAAVRELAADRPREVALAEVVRRLRTSGHVRVRALHGWAKHVRDVDDLLELNQRMLLDLEPACDEERLVQTTVQGAATIDPTATVQASVVRGPAVVGPRARVVDSFVGPYASIGEGAVLEGVEIENSIVLPGAVIRHPGARLEGSVIGRNAKVTRGFDLPRATRLRVGSDAEVVLG
jgi:glucose-1-phosphate thymidylyltransferase